MKILFDGNSQKNDDIKTLISNAFKEISTLKQVHDMPLIIFQDGVNDSFYVKCSIKAEVAAKLCDTNAKLDYDKQESFRANRELLLKNKTYIKMEEDASMGREFNDIIVEYNKEYTPERPLKIWGGQHRIRL